MFWFSGLQNECVKSVTPRDIPGGSVVKNLPANAGDRV